MAVASLSSLTVLLALALPALGGCPGGSAAVGEACDRHSDCEAKLQCAERVCAPRCERASDCGDGYSCDDEGLCQAATGQAGDRCTSETDCAAGLSCQIDGTLTSGDRLLASCTAQNAAAPPGASCTTDADCRNGTCALGRCTDLCRITRDCAAGTSCMAIPRVEANNALYDGCMLSKGLVTWKIPMVRSDDTVYLPVPSGAQHASLVLRVDPPQSVGAVGIYEPNGLRVYRPCEGIGATYCDDATMSQQYYENPLRHRRDVGTSVVAVPSSSAEPLETGAYRVRVSSFTVGGQVGGIPSVTGAVRFGSAAMLDLHFHFLDLADHPCGDAFGGAALDSRSAQLEDAFQTDFLGSLRSILTGGGIGLGTLTYRDVANRPELDSIDVSDAGQLLELGEARTGINVFFVRHLSPAGVQAFGPNPGPAGLGGTNRSGIIVGLDTLCYRSWQQVARITAHELARYMGLYRNVEIGATPWNKLRDQISDTQDTPDNLMFYSELGGTVITNGQRSVLLRSPVLR